MARGKQTDTYEETHLLSNMLDHFTWFTKWLLVFFMIAIVHATVCYLTSFSFRVIYNLILVLVLPAMWYKLRRYRVRDKVKLHYIYLVTIFSVALQVLLDKGIFSMLWERISSMGGTF